MSSARKSGRPATPIDRATLTAIAARHFAERGYAGASLSEIADDAGLRKASLYHHFPTKDALYVAVLDTAVAELRALVLAAGLASGDFAAALDRLGALIIDYFAGHPYVARLLTHEMLGAGEYVRGPGLAAIAANLGATAAFLEAGMRAGVFRRQDPRHLALTIVGLHVFYFATPVTSGAFLEDDIFAPALVRARRAEVLAHVRALCLAPVAAAPPRRAARAGVRSKR
ncbi:MAG: TetR family transcriptional regulator [Deltaproteobacteria bacterium]|nr:TetR family transcriptional regulator [Deltaproteobacteria bacterium]